MLGHQERELQQHWCDLWKDKGDAKFTTELAGGLKTSPTLLWPNLA